ncbi:rhomboid family intramembrane serine protease [Rubinisphaera italica]|uniref:Rhomboid family protein n=1 Tax=Rubinisphaera italica TaxID=2527969 RepID=A0A5C5XM67_9PLAN|nr:rhomboid family intramembrane serine protease [Rubinisphaera italica]TWT64296.1 Rhomboid family protein [Rubinisphaera italica]
MFFFIPYGTDAPIYHWPYGTVGMIVLNVLIFFLVPDVAPYVLEHGNGLQPLEWITSNFIHGDIFHLIGNMIFLWGFGLVVEGKIGTPRFLLVYFGMGIFQCSIEQVLMIASDSGGSSFGASSIIYGLLAISLIWAPKNDLSVYLFVFLIRIIATTFEISILSFGMIYIGLEFVFAVFSGFQMSSAMLHLAGALIGGGIGYVFLVGKWVDCEGWDLISVMKNQHGRQLTRTAAQMPEADYQLKTKKSKKRKKKKPKLAELDSELDDVEVQQSKREKRVLKIRELLKKNKPTAAVSEYQLAKRRMGEFTLCAMDLKSMADGLYRQKMYSESMPFYEQYVDRFPDLASKVRVRLAAIYIDIHQRPRAALRVMSQIDPQELDENAEKIRIKLERQANQLIDEGVLELEGQSWS